MARKAVITIHGVNSVGAWQDDVDRVLAPHFHCLHRKYPDYPAPWGPIRACLGVRAFLAGAVLVGLLVLLATNSIIWSGLLAIPSGLLAGIVHARYRRLNVIERFVSWHGDATLALTEWPHLIAHSFGAFIFGSTMLKHPTMRFDRVILVEAVIPRKVPWNKVESDRPRKICFLRNEVGRQDWVSGAAGMLPPLTGMGCSGAIREGYSLSNYTIEC